MKKLLGTFHIILIIASLVSPWWLDWKLIILGTVIFWIQWKALGGCILTKWQFGTYNTTMWEHIIDKIGIKFNQAYLQIFTTWILPIIIIITAVLIQKP